MQLLVLDLSIAPNSPIRGFPGQRPRILITADKMTMFDAIAILGLLGPYLITDFVLCASISTNFSVLLFKRDFCSSDYQTCCFQTLSPSHENRIRGGILLN